MHSETASGQAKHCESSKGRMIAACSRHNKIWKTWCEKRARRQWKNATTKSLCWMATDFLMEGEGFLTSHCCVSGWWLLEIN